jgi:hypothetical protein
MCRRLAQLEAVCEQAQSTLGALGKDEIYQDEPQPLPQKRPNLWWFVKPQIRRRIERILSRIGFSSQDIQNELMPIIPPAPEHQAVAGGGIGLPAAYAGGPGLTPYNQQTYAALQAAAAGGTGGTVINPYESIAELQDDLSDLTDDELLPENFEDTGRTPDRETAGVRAMNEIVSAVSQIAGTRNLASDLAAYNEAVRADMPELAAQLRARIEQSAGQLNVPNLTESIAVATGGKTPDEYEGYEVRQTPRGTHLIGGFPGEE